MSAITVTNLGKAYKQYPSRWSRLTEWVDPRGKPRHHLHWALQNINFSVEPGEAVGIVGVNGAGKSTLLKMITGTVRPSTGSINVSGRISALLELGMGFHPDFTGRQNVFMAGQLLGLAMDEITELMPEIEAFAEIGDYIDQPVRVYSSGMQVRLAFAVSTAVRPDVLIVDEALSVGDAAFQRKCFRRIEAFRDAGTSLLFVSHDIQAVKRLCDRAVFIHKGKMEGFSDAKSICDLYEAKIFGSKKVIKDNQAEIPEGYVFASSSVQENSSIEIGYGDGSGEVLDVILSRYDGTSTTSFDEGEDIFVKYRVVFKREVDDVIFGVMIKTKDGVCIYGANTASTKMSFGKMEETQINFKLKGNLVAGTYYMNVGVTRGEEDKIVTVHRRMDVIIFNVSGSSANPSPGIANMFAEIEVS